MSTKKIREALLSHGMTHDVREALAEVEAIEKAARYGYLMMTGDIHMAKADEAKAASKAFSTIYDQTGRSEG